MKKFIYIIVLGLFFIFLINKKYIFKPSEMSDEQIHYTILNGSINDVQEIIQNGYNVNKVFHCSTLLNTAIQSAAQGSNFSHTPKLAIEKVKLLVEAGADVNLTPCEGQNMAPLNWAISLPLQAEYVAKKINQAIEERIKNGEGNCDIPTVISKPCKDVTQAEKEKMQEAIEWSYSVISKHLIPYFMEITEYLVSKGADINGYKNNKNQIAPIHLAAINPENTTMEILNYVIKKGANLNVRDKYGNTPLFWAHGAGNIDAVAALKQAGADVNIKNESGLTFNEMKVMPIHSIFNENCKIVLEELK